MGPLELFPREAKPTTCHTGVSDGAIAAKETFEFKLGGKTVDFRSDDHGGVHAGARKTSD